MRLYLCYNKTARPEGEQLNSFYMELLRKVKNNVKEKTAKW